MKKKRCPKTAGKNGHGEDPADPADGLNGKQGQALDALAQGQSTAQAALAAGVSDRTVRRWAKEAPFHAALLELRREPVGQALGLAQRYAPVAVGAMLQILKDPKAPASSKVTAAHTVLKFAVEGVELGDLALRVEALERAGPVTPPPPALPAADMRSVQDKEGES